MEIFKSPLVVEIVKDMSKIVDKLKVLDEKLTLKQYLESPKKKKESSPYYVLNLNNVKFKASIDVISTVPGSKLAGLTQKQLVNQDGSIHIERDPAVFEHVLNYLNSGRKFLPNHVTNQQKNLI